MARMKTVYLEGDKHTPTPWKEEDIIKLVTESPQKEENIKRVVLCINACSRLMNEALREIDHENYCLRIGTGDW